MLIDALSFSAALLLLAVFAAVCSYLLRYAASFYERRAVGWMLALGLTGAFVVTACGWLTYSVTNCAKIAVLMTVEMAEDRAHADFERGRMLGRTDAEMIDDARRRSHEAAMSLELAIAEASLREMEETEARIGRVDRLKAEFARRADEYPLIRKELNSEVEKLSELEEQLRKLLASKLRQD